MSTPELTENDVAILDHLRASWKNEMAETLAPIRTELAAAKSQLTAFGQKLSRPPGHTGVETTSLSAPGGALSRQLVSDGGFQQWLKGVKSSRDYFAVDLKMPSSRKAGTPIMGLSPTEYLPSKIWGAAQFPLRLKELIPSIFVTSGVVEYTVEQSYNPHAAAVVPEGTTKPVMAATFVEATSKVATIAVTIKISKQSFADVPLLSPWLDVRLGYSCSLKEEDVFINGDATNNINGLMQLATPFTYTPVTGDQGMDIIARAIGQLLGQGYQPDGLILNSADFTALRLIKTSIGSYVFMGGGGAPDDESLVDTSMWSVPVVVSPSMPAGQFILGAFQQSAIVYTRETLSVEIAFQNEDDFVRNLVCLRAELRSGLAVPTPAGILRGTLPVIATNEAVKGLFQGAPVKK